MKNQKLSRYKNKSVALFKCSIGWLLSRFYAANDLWLISERGKDARDNAYWFFLYLKQEHPEINCKFIISKDSPDRKRLLSYEPDLVPYDTVAHYTYLWRASYLISTHVMGYTTAMSFFAALDRKYHIFRSKKKIFLQHGIIKDYMPNFNKGKVDLDVFCCGAEPEWKYVCEKNGQPDTVAQYTGLCRFDQLNSFDAKKQILVMPTWRKYIDRLNFEGSEYFIQYKNLLTSPQIHDLLNKYEYKLIFYPHYEVQGNIESFRNLELPKNVTVAGFEYDVQQLLKESMLLITDFSSVYFDMAYMRKPILFFQFDEARFREGHYSKGYIEESNLGVKVHSIEDLITAIEKLLKDECVSDAKYTEYADSFFPLRDNNNCLRVFNAIRNIERR